MSTDVPHAIVDASALIAVFNRLDKDHERCVNALSRVRTQIISPVALAETDYRLTEQAGPLVAANAISSLRALASLGYARLSAVTPATLAEAEPLMRRYADQPIGLADAVNAVLAWKLPRPVILSLDHHYSDVIAPRHPGEHHLEVVPDRLPNKRR